MNKKIYFFILFVFCLVLIQAESLYVLGTGNTSGVAARLSFLGHTVTTGSSLSNYSGYDQVWDLRYGATISSSEQSVYSSYLSSGGRLYFVAEHPSYNVSGMNALVNFASAVGGGSLTGLTSATGAQNLTSDIKVDNTLASINFASGSAYTGIGNGIALTLGSGNVVSTIGWKIGSMSNAMSGSMIMTFDSNLFGTSYNTQSNIDAWISNGVAFLKQDAVVPEASSLCFLALGLLILFLNKK